jgi:signal transduction histidine kinase
MNKLLAKQSELALEFDLAIREYVEEHIRPFAEQHVGQDEFIPETMSTSFVARNIFEKVNKKFPDYILKFSSDDPRNPNNLAGPEELEMIQYFNNNPDIQSWTGHTNLNGKSHIVQFGARRMKESCLRCHGNPDDAPESLIALYGDKAGFHRPVGDIIALDTVAIPVDKYRVAALANTIRQSAIVLIALVLLLIAVYFTFQILVTQRLMKISGHFTQAIGDVGKSTIKPISYDTNDEIGDLVQAFNNMIRDLETTTNSAESLNKEIAERKKAESKQVELITKVDNINKELKEFASIVSHDLKAPLRGIKTLADWILSENSDKLDDEAKEQMNLLLERVDRMHNLIEGVLQYSRAGRTQGKPAKVNLNEFIPEVINMVVPPENIKVTIENDLPVIDCEEIHVMEIFQNLLSNAIKYMDKPQGLIKISCAEQEGFWKFSVSDNGPGIEEQYFEKIFKIFQALPTSPDFEGTGVGLTVAKKLVNLYNGEIWVESKVGQGSTFFFTLQKQVTETSSYDPQIQISC